MQLTAEIFSLLDEADRSVVESALRRLELDAGTSVFHQGDPGNELFIVERGMVRTSLELPDGGEHELARFGPGDFFGEMSIFENASRSATCTAVEPSVLAGLSREAFGVLERRHPAAAIRLMLRMLNVTTRRLRTTSGLVTEMVLWGEQARKRAVTDELTGTYNRRFIEDSLEGLVADCRTAGRPITVFMSDLDHFREINECYGHTTGDEAIKAAAGVYKRVVGDRGYVARYGGDEFVIIVPGADAAAAMAIGEEICEGVRKCDLLAGRTGKVTRLSTSLGLASCPEHGADAAALRTKADAALYKAKEQGRDRTVSFKE